MNASPNPSTYGQAVFLTAQVTAGATGKVTFYDGTTILGIATISGGQASSTTQLLASGTRKLRVYYGGDGAYAPSTSANVTQSVVAGASLGLQPAAGYAVSGPAYANVVGDFNGDGKLDIAVGIQLSSAVNILLGNGDGKFSTALSCATPAPVNSLALGDFNGDGKSDLVVVMGSSTNTIGIMLGNGDGTFQTAVTYTVGQAPSRVVVGDFNGDGKADLAVTNYSSNNVSILLGRGDGTFQSPANYTTGSGPVGLAIGDFNNDGKADLVVANSSSSNISVLIGNGNGTFQAAVDYTVDYTAQFNPDTVVVSDFNGDGNADVAVAPAGSSAVGILLGNGDGTFQAQTYYATGDLTMGLAAGDLNGDGKQDLVAANTFGNSISVLLGNGDGTFQSAVTYPATAYPIGVALGDFNGDGKTDVAISSQTVSSVAVYLGGAIPDLTIAMTQNSALTQGEAGAAYTISVSNAGSFATYGSVGVVDALPAGLTATGISGNGWACGLGTLYCGRSDSLAPGASYPAITITFNVSATLTGEVVNSATVSGGGDGNLSNNTAADTTIARYSTTTALASSTNPSMLGQLVTLTATVTAGATGLVTFYSNTAFLGTATLSGNHAALTTSLLLSGSQALRAEYDGDSNYGPSTSAGLTQTSITLESNGYQRSQSYSVGDQPVALALGDFNLDGKPDLVTANYDTVSVLLGNGDGTFQNAMSSAGPSCCGFSIAVGDFNRDGKPDLAIAASPGLWLLLGNGDGTFQSPIAIGQYSGTYFESSALAAADFNGDGNLDLAVVAGSAMAILLGNGDGTFQAPASYSIFAGGFTPGMLAIADLNGDGKPDVVLGTTSSASAVTVMLGNGDGTFQTPVAYGVANSYYDSTLFVGDFNGDGKQDVGVLYPDAVGLLLGSGAGALQAAVTSALSQVPGGAAATGDFNGDGYLDFVYRGYVSSTLTLAFGNGNGTFQPGLTLTTDSSGGNAVTADFNGDGRPDLAVTNSSANTVEVFFGGQFAGLSLAATHSGNFFSGETGAIYQLTVTNPAFASTAGAVSVTDIIPAGFVAAAIGGAGWTCALGTLTCIRSDALSFGDSYPAITVTVNVPTYSSPVVETNRATVTSGGVQDSASDATSVLPPWAASLVIAKSHFGNFSQGQTGAAYTVTVSNQAGAIATSGEVEVTDQLPVWLTATAIGGTGWSCVLATVTCARSDSLQAGASYPPITVTVDVPVNAPSPVTNQVTVSGGGSATASASDLTTIAVATAATTALRLIPAAPCRVIDTRNATGTFGGPYIAGGSTRAIPIPSSSCGIPSDAAAYSLNVTVLPRTGSLDYLSVWPTGQSEPGVSTLNSYEGAVLANAAIVPAGTSGSIDVYATDDTDLLIDINGYFVAVTAGPLQFYPLTPCRILDTRNATGTFGGPSLEAGVARSFPIPSSGCEVPSGAGAYAFNVTVVPQGGLDYLTAWPTGGSEPGVSTLNSYAGTVLANAAIVPAGSGGAVSFYASNTTDLLVDISGYFAAPGAGGLNFYTVPPCRIVDTRNTPDGTFAGPIMGASTTRAFPLSQGPCGIPESAAAYSLNVTVQPSGPLDFLGIGPAGVNVPGVSTLNSYAGEVVANAAIVPAGTGGAVNVYVTNAAHVIIDTNGYFQ